MKNIKQLHLPAILILSSYFLYGVIFPIENLKKALDGESVPIDQPSVFFTAFLAGILAIYLLIKYFKRDNKIQRTIMSEKSVKINDIFDGQRAKIVGKVKPVPTPIVAPLSGKKCVYYQAIIEELSETHDVPTYHTIIEEKDCCDFFIADGTGLAEIKPYQATIYLQKDLKKDTGFFKSMDERMKNFLEKHNLDSSKFLGINPPYRFQEGMIEIGEQIAVFGHCKRKVTSDQYLKREYPESLVFTNQEQHPLYLSDEPDTF